MMDKIIKLSHSKFHKKDFINIINILLKNNYPFDFIFVTINLKTLFYKTDNNNNDNSSLSLKRTFFIISYINSVSNRFIPISTRLNHQIAFMIPHTFKKFITTLDNRSRCEVIYKINS